MTNGIVRTGIFLLAAMVLALVLTVEAAAFLIDSDGILRQRMDENLCALTFDDGPSKFTPQLLDDLADYGIPATFFVLGQQAERHPDIIRRMLAEGHEVENHSYSHPNLRKISRVQKIHEIEATDAILRELGAKPRFLRPPYGAYDDRVLEQAERLGLSLVLWSVDTKDWRSLPVDYTQLRNSKGHVFPPGTVRGIFLFHDTHRTTVEDFPRIVQQLKEGGCSRFVTVEEYIDSRRDNEPGAIMSRRRNRAVRGLVLRPAHVAVELPSDPVPEDGAVISLPAAGEDDPIAEAGSRPHIDKTSPAERKTVN
ncbi:MAG: polysaccharide deacetylase family protein [Desulfovibrio sp.]|nr:polysaccharide deacetylase family protein [Desulfovibrio sp.]